MNAEEIFKKWKGEAPRGATHCLIIPARSNEGICWFVGKDFYVAVREHGVTDHRYSKGLDAIKEESKSRIQLLIPLKPLVLENK